MGRTFSEKGHVKRSMPLIISPRPIRSFFHPGPYQNLPTRWPTPYFNVSWYDRRPLPIGPRPNVPSGHISLMGRTNPIYADFSQGDSGLGSAHFNEGPKSAVSYNRVHSCPNPQETNYISAPSSTANVASFPGLGNTKNRGRFFKGLKPKLKEHFSVCKVNRWIDFASMRKTQGKKVTGCSW